MIDERVCAHGQRLGKGAKTKTSEGLVEQVIDDRDKQRWLAIKVLGARHAINITYVWRITPERLAYITS